MSEPIEQLIDELIDTHHARLRAQVLRIDQIARHMVRHGEADDPPLLEILQLVQGLSACVDSQLTSEEQVLFPMLRRLQHQSHVTRCRAGMISSRVRITEREFARIRGVMARLGDLTSEFGDAHQPCDDCHALSQVIDELLQDLHEHSEKELGRLYPWAVAREQELST